MSKFLKACSDFPACLEEFVMIFVLPVVLFPLILRNLFAYFDAPSAIRLFITDFSLFTILPSSPLPASSY